MQLTSYALTSKKRTSDELTPTVLAIFETIIAVALMLSLSSYFGIYTFLMGASFAAFMFLLRTDRSVSDGKRFFEKMFREAPDPNMWMRPSANGRESDRFQMAGIILAISLSGVGSMLVALGVLGEYVIYQSFIVYLAFSFFSLNLAFFTISIFGSFANARIGAFVLFLATSALTVGMLFSSGVFLSTIFIVVAILFTILWGVVSFLGAGSETALPSGAVGLVFWALGAGAFSDLSGQSQVDLTFTVGAPLVVILVSTLLALVGAQKATVAVGLVGAIAVRALAARFLGTILNLPAGLKSFPQNWIEQTFCVDCTSPPELVPGLATDHAMSFSTWINHSKTDKSAIRSQEDLVHQIEHLFITILIFCPAIIYRLFLKSSAWIYFPIVWFFDVPSKLKSDAGRHVWIGTAGRSKWDIFLVSSSFLILLLTFLRVFDLQILQEVYEVISERKLPFVPLAFMSSVSIERFVVWDAVAIPVASLTVVLFFWLDSLRVKLEFGASLEDTVTYWRLLLFLEQLRNKLGFIWILISLATVIQVFLLVHVCPTSCRIWASEEVIL